MHEMWTGVGLSHDMHKWTFCQISFTKNTACLIALATTWANYDLAMGTDVTAIKLQNKSINRNQTGLDLSLRHFYKHLISVSDTSV